MTFFNSKALNRRKFLAGAAAIGVGTTLPLLQSRAAFGADVALEFEGWNYDPEFQTQIVTEYTAQNPAVSVNFIAEPAAQYVPKMIARFIGQNAPDLLYVRDQTLAGWADAEYIRPINDFPDWEEHVAGLIPFHRAGLEYEGKVWGLPYYGDHIAYIYNSDILEKAGIAAPPVTWAELADQSLAIKKAGLIERPFAFPLKSNAGLHWWSAVYASGGSLFDAEGNPKFPDEDTVALQLLEFLVHAAQELDILDQTSVQMGTAEGRLALAAGQVAFASSARYDLKVINDPATSKVSGFAKQVLFPSLTADGPHGTVGWTQMFSISSNTAHPDEAWDVLKYISSQDVAKRYYLKNGVGYAYEALDNDADIAAETSKWSDQGMFAKQGALAKPREYIAFPWAAEWEDFHMQQMQEAIVGRKTARDAMLASADKAIQLKKSS
ncbi:MAG: Carbohydrate transporter substrate-binding protein family [Devosia sp.]|uniref:ABC transporter substrate-binding protein n=1 Tax=Devosia sp. TaxID=1871048 RepID=UPI002610F13F|nr:extracellular solute-binding protein [Devosia sp.]MDB5529900.1 Carbohydrate transporter substrate-binding protein family [Devosia sp.]